MRDFVRSIEIFYFDAGGGHRNVMNALVHVLGQRHPDWRIVPVDLQKLLEPVDPVHRLSQRISGPLQRLMGSVSSTFVLEPFQAQDVYNGALKRGTTRGLGVILPILQGFIRHRAPVIEDLLRRYWSRPEAITPDLIVSVVPNFNGVMFRAAATAHPDVPYVTVMTDMVDCPPHFWMENQDQYLICGTHHAFEQALATDFYDPAKVFEVSGMILKASFYDPPGATPPTRRDLGLDEGRPTALIMFGGNGALRASLDIVDRFAVSSPGLQTIVMCGNNRRLVEALRGRPGCHAVGFVSNVADYMRLADFFIGKPGPGSISEAIHMGCPVIVERNAHTMPQERPNVDWILEHGVGLAVKSFKREIVAASGRMLRDLDLFRAAIATNISANRAVYETVELLGRIVEGAPIAPAEGPPARPDLVAAAAEERPARRWTRRLLRRAR